jgi:hypothetical protein
MKYKKVLVLAPQTDDGELVCGATINRMIEEGSEVYYLAFSACEQSVLKEFSSDILMTEAKEATQIKEKCIIGSNVTTGMGSVVIKDIPANEVWADIPAIFLKKVKI